MLYFVRIIETLDPDPDPEPDLEPDLEPETDSLEMLDPNPDSMNLDPQKWQHCCKVYNYRYFTVPANPPRIVIS